MSAGRGSADRGLVLRLLVIALVMSAVMSAGALRLLRRPSGPRPEATD